VDGAAEDDRPIARNLQDIPDCACPGVDASLAQAVGDAGGDTTCLTVAGRVGDENNHHHHLSHQEAGADWICGCLALSG
jgi:hypothetical protein